MALGRERPWRMSSEGHRPQLHYAWHREWGRATRRIWRRSVVVQRALIRRWGHLLLPARHQHCTMETDRSGGKHVFHWRRSLCMSLWKPACASDFLDSFSISCSLKWGTRTTEDKNSFRVMINACSSMLQLHGNKCIVHCFHLPPHKRYYQGLFGCCLM